MSVEKDYKVWSDKIAKIIIAELVDAKIITQEMMLYATEITAEEILVRLCMNDYPPPLPLTSEISTL